MDSSSAFQLTDVAPCPGPYIMHGNWADCIRPPNFWGPHVQQRDLTSLWWPLLAFENLMIYGPGADGTHVHATFEILLPVRLAGLPIRILIQIA